MPISQSASTILMVSPSSFGYDAETAQTNHFQVKPQQSDEKVVELAVAEFDEAVSRLRAAGIDVMVYQPPADSYRPDAVFPNNWLSTWPDGKVYTYPMATASRRIERDPQVIAQLDQRFMIDEVIRLEQYENQQCYLESTGAIVFDHLSKIAYGCVSERCDQALFTQHVNQLGYQPISFNGLDKSGAPIYHTNVMLAVQSTTAVVYSHAIVNQTERQAVLDSLASSRQIIDIDWRQLTAFCANLLEVVNRSGQKFLILSQTAYEAFSPEQRHALARDKQLLPINIPTIEAAGGGSARCMLAEIFLPDR